MAEFDYDALRQAIVEGNEDLAVSLGSALLDSGDDVMVAVNAASDVIREVGDQFGAGELFLPEMVLAAEAMQGFMGVVTPHLEAEAAKEGGEVKKATKVVVGTVKGDIHSIGKNIVATMLGASGYEVIDLGVNVSPMDAIQEAERAGASIIGLSALMTTSMPFQKEVISLLNELDRRDDFWIMVGGGPVTREYAGAIGANGWGPDAAAAVQAADSIVTASSTPTTTDLVVGGAG